MTILPKPLKRPPKPKKPIKRGKRPRKIARKTLRNKADKLFSEAIRARDGHQCQVCGSVKRMTCGHLVSRRYMATRWDFQNAVAQCAGCNLRAKFDGLWWEAWIEERFGARRLKLLKARARGGVAKVDLEGVVKSLE